MDKTQQLSDKAEPRRANARNTGAFIFIFVAGGRRGGVHYGISIVKKTLKNSIT